MKELNFSLIFWYEKSKAPKTNLSTASHSQINYIKWCDKKYIFSMPLIQGKTYIDEEKHLNNLKFVFSSPLKFELDFSKFPNTCILPSSRMLSIEAINVIMHLMLKTKLNASRHSSPISTLLPLLYFLCHSTINLSSYYLPQISEQYGMLIRCCSWKAISSYYSNKIMICKRYSLFQMMLLQTYIAISYIMIAVIIQIIFILEIYYFTFTLPVFQNWIYTLTMTLKPNWGMMNWI